jgi:hypothetical protein
MTSPLVRVRESWASAQTVLRFSAKSQIDPMRPHQQSASRRHLLAFMGPIVSQMQLAATLSLA